MFDATFDITSSVRKIKALQELGSSIVSETMRDVALSFLVPKMRELLKLHIFHGDLYKKVSARVASQNSIEVGVFGVSHALNIEVGSPPHTPDFAKILEWVRTKVKAKTGGGTLKRASKRVRKIDLSIAALVVAHIEKHGTKAYPFVMPIWNANKAEYFRRVIVKLKNRLRKV